MLFSATSTRKTEDLIKLALKNEPMFVGIEDKTPDMPATVSGLEQGYVICPSDKRLLLLFTFLKKNRKKKVMVFFSSCMSVKYHNELFNYIDLSVMCIHVSFAIYLTHSVENYHFFYHSRENKNKPSVLPHFSNFATRILEFCYVLMLPLGGLTSLT